MGETVIRLGRRDLPEHQRRVNLVEQVNRLADQGTHLVESEVTDLFAVHGLPLQHIDNQPGAVSEVDPSKFESSHAVVIFAAKRARQVNAYYSQLGEGLLEYVGPIIEFVKPQPVTDAQAKSVSDTYHGGSK